MLRITRDDESRSRVTLRLEGTIAGEWTWLLERECAVLLETRSVVSLDLAGVSYVDRGGVEVLERLSRAGVEIWCRWEPVASVLEGEGVHVRRNHGSPPRGDRMGDDWT
jgi:hypothetical protein